MQKKQKKRSTKSKLQLKIAKRETRPPLAPTNFHATIVHPDSCGQERMTLLGLIKTTVLLFLVEDVPAIKVNIW
jgi:hypothetical protein